MKRTGRTLVIVTVLVSAAAFMTGCSPRASDLVSDGAVSLHKTSDKGVRIMWAEVRQEGQYAVVTGRLVPGGARSWRTVGHVDVEFAGPDGQVVAQGCSKPMHVLRCYPGHGSNTRRFEVRSQTNLPAGAKVQVAFRYGAECEG